MTEIAVEHPRFDRPSELLRALQQQPGIYNDDRFVVQYLRPIADALGGLNPSPEEIADVLLASRRAFGPNYKPGSMSDQQMELSQSLVIRALTVDPDRGEAIREAIRTAPDRWAAVAAETGTSVAER